MATQPAEQTANPVAVIRQNLVAMEPEFKAALPPHIPVERFKRVALTAIQNTPALAQADRRSLFGALVRLAQDGLLPDGREAAVVMFGNKAQAMPMIAGILKRVRQSGEVARVSAQVVYKNDTFTVRYGFDEDVEHIPPALDEPRGEPIGAYATAVLKDGSQLLEVMSLEEIEKVRAVSRAARNGPWVAWWSEMARKTVMRRLSKRLPMSTDLEDEIFSRDETMRPTTIEAVAQPEPQTVVPLSRLDAIEHQIETPQEPEVITEQAEEIEAEIVDETTGEITRGTTLGEQLDADDAHPGKAIADGLIDEINALISVLDISTLMAARELDIKALAEDDFYRVNEAANARKAKIRAAQAKAKKESAE